MHKCHAQMHNQQMNNQQMHKKMAKLHTHEPKHLPCRILLRVKLCLQLANMHPERVLVIGQLAVTLGHFFLGSFFAHLRIEQSRVELRDGGVALAKLVPQRIGQCLGSICFVL